MRIVGNRCRSFEYTVTTASPAAVDLESVAIRGAQLVLRLSTMHSTSSNRRGTDKPVRSGSRGDSARDPSVSNLMIVLHEKC